MVNSSINSSSILIMELSLIISALEKTLKEHVVNNCGDEFEIEIEIDGFEGVFCFSGIINSFDYTIWEIDASEYYIEYADFKANLTIADIIKIEEHFTNYKF